MKPNWKQRAANVIAEVIAANPGVPIDSLRRLCNDAYPFGERKYFPYDAWNKAMAEAFGPTPKKLQAMAAKKEREDDATGQGRLL